MAASWVVLHVTNRCQLNCKHCLRDPSRKARDISLAVVESLLDQALRVYGTDHVGLTGGEPTLHPEFEVLVDAIVDRGMTWHIVTNGDRFQSRFIDTLLRKPARKAALTAVDFSVDGADTAVHDRIRGAGSYAQVLRAITLSRFHEIPFMLQMAVNAYNAHQLESFALGAAQLGASRVSFGMTQPTGTYLDAELFLPTTAWQGIQDRIDRLSNILAVPVTRTEGFRSPRRFHECEPFRSEILHVDYDGVMNLCCMHAGVPGGDGRSSHIADLHRDSLVTSHRKMLDLIQEFRLAKLDRLEASPDDSLGDAWDRFPCNDCLKYFGKPHWSDDGAQGPAARRERWRGAWAPEHHRDTEIPVAARHMPTRESASALASTPALGSESESKREPVPQQRQEAEATPSPESRARKTMQRARLRVLG